VSYLLAFLGFAALIVLHEFGHFVAAKAVGMRVERFSLFFGPMVVKKRIGETEYGIGVIPLGGFVKITGMTPEEEFENPSVEARAYTNMPVWKRIVVIFAGPLVNLLIAFVLLLGVVMSQGVSTRGLFVKAVEKGSPEASVLRPRDQLLSVDGFSSEAGIEAAVNSSRCAGAQVNGCVGKTPVYLRVKRDGQLRTFAVHPRYSAAKGRQLIGFDFGGGTMYPGVLSASGYSVRAMWSEASHSVSALGRIFESKERKQLHSAVGIYRATEQAISTNAWKGVEILALISLALAVFNLFPFLPLDGGHIFWALMEKLRGRKISLATIERASIIGLVLMMVLVGVGLSNDIPRLVSGGSFLSH
jgi:regulator of sigma E protease